MLSEAMNERLTRVGPGTPCGELLRRYWHPVAIAAELTPEKPRKRVRILGEELVVWRTPEGDWGCMAEHCAHRGCSLYYGFVEEGGLRCPYHGWLYDTSGQCREQPFEPPNAHYRERTRLPAYRVQKLAGLLFIYMGPEPAPLLPRWDVLVREDGKRRIEIRGDVACNWLQIQENTADTTHTYYLHGHSLHVRGLKGGSYFYRPILSYDFAPCEWGIAKRCVYGGDYVEEEIRPPLIFPNILRIPVGNGAETIHWRVPFDDTHTFIFQVNFTPNATGTAEPQPEDPPVDYFPSDRTEDGDFDMRSFYSQDKMAWETPGPLFNRSHEHLGATDRGIIMFRKMLEEQIQVVEQGGQPMALVWDESQNQCISFVSSKPILQPKR